MPENRRLTAIMFTDIVGYTALMGKDERKAHEMIHANRKIQLSLIHHYNGTCLKEMGDGLMASFPSAINAVLCGVKIQQFAMKENIPLRIGIHQGDVIFENNDVLGDGVNIASRIEQATKPGCISISQTVYNEIKNKPDIEAEFLDEMALKNVTEPVKVYKVKFDDNVDLDYGLIKETIPGKLKWKGIYTFIGVIILAAIVLIVFFPKLINQPPEDIDRSIAVLPFDNESDEESNIYFVNGMTEDIRNNLAKIGELRVISKTSTEKYRERTSAITVHDIANELEVSYLLEGTVQKVGDRVKIHAQLIRTDTDDHVWSETYTRDLVDVFSLQNEIAQAIAKNLYAVITPQELEIIGTLPTENITAYDIFLQARNEHNKYWLDGRNTKALEEAITLYRRALEYDSTFARAYTGLALAYSNKHYWSQYFNPTFMDSVLILAKKALSFDDQLDEAYYVRGLYYSSQKDGINNAIHDFEKALKINPNYAEVYYEKSILDAWYFDDFVEAIKNRRKAVHLDHGPFLPRSLRDLGNMYSTIGFFDLAENTYFKALQLDNDSVKHYSYMSWNYYLGKGNILEAYKAGLKAYKIDSTEIFSVMLVMQFSSFLGKYEEANQYALKLIKIYESFNMRLPGDWHRIGFTYLKLGNIQLAEKYFDEQIKWCEESIKLGRRYATSYGAHYDLACVLALRGETDRAIDLLSEMKNKNFWPSWGVEQFKYEPFFESLRNDARFQEIFQDLKSKYQKEHDRVKAWMEEEDQAGS